MKILLIVDDYLPHSIKAAAQIMHDLAVEFKNHNHAVTVLTPRWGQKELLIEDSYEGVKVLYFKSGKIKNTRKLNRTINETLLPFRALQAIRYHIESNAYDGIASYSPSIFWGLLIRKLKYKWNCKSYLILRDIFPQWTLDSGLMSRFSLPYFYFKVFELINYNTADRIGVMTPSIIDYFKQRYSDTSKFELLFNWSKVIRDEFPKGFYRDKLNLDNKVVFFYGGNIGHAQKMINLVLLAKRLKHYEDVHFLIIGVGDEVDLILKYKEQYDLQNITYLPSVDQKTYFNMLSEFDVGIFMLNPDHQTNNFPGKLLGYMLYSKPILGYVNYGNDLKGIIDEYEAGIVIDNCDGEMLYDSAVKLINSQELRVKMGHNSFKLLNEKFSVNSVYTQLINFFS